MDIMESSSEIKDDGPTAHEINGKEQEQTMINSNEETGLKGLKTNESNETSNSIEFNKDGHGHGEIEFNKEIEDDKQEVIVPEIRLELYNEATGEITLNEKAEDLDEEQKGTRDLKEEEQKGNEEPKKEEQEGTEEPEDEQQNVTDEPKNEEQKGIEELKEEEQKETEDLQDGKQKGTQEPKIEALNETEEPDNKEQKEIQEAKEGQEEPKHETLELKEEGKKETGEPKNEGQKEIEGINSKGQEDENIQDGGSNEVELDEEFQLKEQKSNVIAQKEEKAHNHEIKSNATMNDGKIMESELTNEAQGDILTGIESNKEIKDKGEADLLNKETEDQCMNDERETVVEPNEECDTNKLNETELCKEAEDQRENGLAVIKNLEDNVENKIQLKEGVKCEEQMIKLNDAIKGDEQKMDIESSEEALDSKLISKPSSEKFEDKALSSKEVLQNEVDEELQTLKALFKEDNKDEQLQQVVLIDVEEADNGVRSSKKDTTDDVDFSMTSTDVTGCLGDVFGVNCEINGSTRIQRATPVQPSEPKTSQSRPTPVLADENADHIEPKNPEDDPGDDEDRSTSRSSSPPKIYPRRTRSPSLKGLLSTASLPIPRKPSSPAPVNTPTKKRKTPTVRTLTSSEKKARSGAQKLRRTTLG